MHRINLTDGVLEVQAICLNFRNSNELAVNTDMYNKGMLNHFIFFLRIITFNRVKR